MGQKKLFGPEHSSSIDWDKCHPIHLTRDQKYTITTQRDAGGTGTFAFIIYHGPKSAPKIFYFVKDLGKRMKQTLVFKASRKDLLHLSYWINHGRTWKQIPAAKM
jgi:hypothetical protein